MIAEVADRRDEIAALCQRFGVRRLELFGSAATGAFDPLTSDIDLLVDYPEGHDLGPWLDQYFALKDELRWLLGCPVDLVMTDARNSPAFWSEVDRSQEVIYDAATVPAMAD